MELKQPVGSSPVPEVLLKDDRKSCARSAIEETKVKLRQTIPLKISLRTSRVYSDMLKRIRERQQNRIQNNLVIVTDERENFEVTLAGFDRKVDVLKIPEMKFSNVFSSIKQHSKFGKGTIFVFCGGTHDLLHYNVLPDCLTFFCRTPQQVLTIPLYNGNHRYLVMKALKLNYDILDYTDNDVAIFCGLIPIPFDQYNSYTIANRQCFSFHPAKTVPYGDKRNFTNYRIAVKRYNDFTKYHAQALSFDPWNLEQFYFSKPKLNIFLSNLYNICPEEVSRRSKLVKNLCKKIFSTISTLPTAKLRKYGSKGDEKNVKAKHNCTRSSKYHSTRHSDADYKRLKTVHRSSSSRYMDELNDYRNGRQNYTPESDYHSDRDRHIRIRASQSPRKKRTMFSSAVDQSSNSTYLEFYDSEINLEELCGRGNVKGTYTPESGCPSNRNRHIQDRKSQSPRQNRMEISPHTHRLGTVKQPFNLDDCNLPTLEELHELRNRTENSYVAERHSIHQSPKAEVCDVLNSKSCDADINPQPTKSNGSPYLDTQEELRKRLGQSLYTEYTTRLEVVRTSFERKFALYQHIPELYTHYRQYYETFATMYVSQFGSQGESDRDEHKNKLWKQFWQSSYEEIKKEEWNKDHRSLLVDYMQKATAQSPASSTISSSDMSSASSLTSFQEEAVQNVKTMSRPLVCEEALSLLECACDKISYLGPALQTIIQSCRALGSTTKEAHAVFTDPENLPFLKISLNKFKKLQLSATGDACNMYRKVVDWLSELLSETEVEGSWTPNIDEMPIDLNAIASVTVGKGDAFTLEVIRTTLAYEGVVDTPEEVIGKLFLKVCSLHFAMSCR